MQTSLILLHPGFQGERWTRDQSMPEPFPAPLQTQGKRPVHEVRYFGRKKKTQ